MNTQTIKIKPLDKIVFRESDMIFTIVNDSNKEKEVEIKIK